LIGDGFIYLEGTWHADGGKVLIVNIYSPCDAVLKRNSREQIRQIKHANIGDLCCIIGDFNCIRRPSERIRTCQRMQDEGIMKEFNEWIADLGVEEVSSVGRRFTWYRPNGTAKSRLDRVLVSTKWFAKWKGSTQLIMDHNFSDHCPILLRSTCANWGPKPFRTLDYWFKDKSFRKIVRDSWTTNDVSGWGVLF